MCLVAWLSGVALATEIRDVKKDKYIF
jgi:hypothetical protein